MYPIIYVGNWNLPTVLTNDSIIWNGEDEKRNPFGTLHISLHLIISWLSLVKGLLNTNSTFNYSNYIYFILCPFLFFVWRKRRSTLGSLSYVPICFILLINVSFSVLLEKVIWKNVSICITGSLSTSNVPKFCFLIEITNSRSEVETFRKSCHSLP